MHICYYEFHVLCLLRMSVCLQRALVCLLRVLICLLRVLVCLLRVLVCLLRVLVCLLRVLVCLLRVLVCLLSWQSTTALPPSNLAEWFCLYRLILIQCFWGWKLYWTVSLAEDQRIKSCLGPCPICFRAAVGWYTRKKGLPNCIKTQERIRETYSL
jgi:hypothetical protein